ncbi:hypothetical protein F2P79_023955, partial [Pimephales promelas]
KQVSKEMHCYITVPDHRNNTLGCGIAAVWRVPPDCSCLALCVCVCERAIPWGSLPQPRLPDSAECQRLLLPTSFPETPGHNRR